MDDRLYWLALCRIPGIGDISCKRLLDVFKTPRRIFAAAPGDLLRIEGLHREAVQNILSGPLKAMASDLSRELSKAERTGARLMTLEDQDYPEALKNIDDPPPCFYIRGTLLPRDHLSISVVGSRKPTAYGKTVIRRITQDLSDAGLTIVSGLARGIDSVAHLAALESGGRTIAVLGSGITIPYPPENALLMNRIAGQGAVLSEFPPDAPPEGHHFPRRNRMISGLSLGTLVVEAAEKSGSLITARLAMEQGREVFAVPGNVTSPLSRGAHRLIQQGAKLVEKIEDILEELNIPRLTVSGKHGIKESSASSRPGFKSEFLPEFTEDEAQVFGCLTCDVPQHPDEIANACRLPAQQVLTLLLSLEMKAVIRREDGNLYLKIWAGE
jgi:DNA processing protein